MGRGLRWRVVGALGSGFRWVTGSGRTRWLSRRLPPSHPHLSFLTRCPRGTSGRGMSSRPLSSFTWLITCVVVFVGVRDYTAAPEVWSGGRSVFGPRGPVAPTHATKIYFLCQNTVGKYEVAPES